MSNPITPVGPLASYTGSYVAGAHTLAVNPSAVGDVLVMVTNVGSTTHHATGLSGGGVTSWQHVAGSAVSFDTSMDLWMGVVTAAGPSIITAAGSLAGFVNQFVAQQFTGGSVWSVDAAAIRNNVKARNISWPALVAAGSGELYVGFGTSPLGGAAGTQTAGYTLALVNGNLFLFNVSVSGVQSPTCANAFAPNVAPSTTLAALISAA